MQTPVNMSYAEFKLVGDNAITPTRATTHSAAYDLTYCGASQRILPGHAYVAPTGVAIIGMEANECAFVLSRSGLAAKHGIHVLNAPGLIDADYNKEIFVILHNASPNAFDLEPFTRIAQLLLTRYSTLGDIISVQRQSGLGSTGV